MDAKPVGSEILSAIGAVGEYAIQVDDDTIVPIISLSPGVLGEIAVRFNATFNDIVFHPLTRVDALEATVLACFKKAGKKEPKKQFRDTRDLLPYLVEIPSTLPVPDIAGAFDEEPSEADPTEASSTGS